MSNDLVNRLRKLADDMEKHATDDWDEHEDVATAADRIEQLERDLKNTQDDFTEQLGRAEKETCLRIDAEAKLAKAVEAAFTEGFLAATADGWINNPRIETEWKRSEARTTLAEIYKQ